MKATFVKNVKGFREHAELFRLEEPKNNNYVRFRFIVVSTLKRACDTGMAETHIFPANSRGEVLNWMELDGSFQGAIYIDKALRDGGYEVIR